MTEWRIIRRGYSIYHMHAVQAKKISARLKMISNTYSHFIMHTQLNSSDVIG